MGRYTGHFVLRWIVTTSRPHCAACTHYIRTPTVRSNVFWSDEHTALSHDIVKGGSRAISGQTVYTYFCVCKIINGFGDLSKLMQRKSGGVGHNSQMSCCIHFPKDPWCGNLLGARVCTGFGKYPCLWVTVLLMLMSWCRLMTLHFARFACWFMCLKNHMSITRLKWICQFECAVQSADLTDGAGQNDYTDFVGKDAVFSINPSLLWCLWVWWVVLVGD